MLGDEKVTFKLDTGADINCVLLGIVKRLNMKIENQHNTFNVVDYNENRVKNFGTTKLKCLELNGKMKGSAEFVVVNDRCEPIRGLETCEELRLVKRLDVSSIACVDTKAAFMECYQNVFHGLCKFLGTFKIN